MKIVGLIAEYNPFHTGHLYHMEQARKRTGADAVLVVMSGDFVQRGAPAILPKHLRAEMALRAGADAVIELPVCYACGSAEYFAAGAVSLLNQLGCIDSICFGSECGNLTLLAETARILTEEPEEYKALLGSFLKSGNPFPRARQLALCACQGEDALTDDVLTEVLAHPNNILGIEYLKALYTTGSKMTPYTITRRDSGYHDEHLSNIYSSASAIRKRLAAMERPGELSVLDTHIPDACLTLLKETYSRRYPVLTDDFSLLLKYRLLQETAESLTRYLDVTEDIANRIINCRNSYISYEQFCDVLKTKDITRSRISRCLLHILLGITSEDMMEYKAYGFCQYARLLGFRRESKGVLSHMKEHSSIPIITKLTRTDSLTSVGLKMLRLDIHASSLYESVVTDKFHTTYISEFCQQIVTVDSAGR